MKIHKIKTLILTIAALAGLLGTLPTAAMAVDCSSSTENAIQCGINGAGGAQSAGQASTNINDTIHSIVDLLSVVVGIIAVIMIIIAGLRYITSGGVSEKVTAAKNTILYAVVGLVVVALAQVIVRFVLTNTTTDCVNHKTNTGQSC